MASQQNIPPNPHCICQDGTFKLTLEFSEEYPNKPPVVKFLSKMFHPNIIRGRWHLPRHSPEQVEPHLRRLRHPHQYPVTGRGQLYLILNLNISFYWKLFDAFSPQLSDPNPNSPANSMAAQLFKENRREYEKRVKACVEQSWVDCDE